MEREGRYFIDPESATEMARLLEQDAIVTQGKPLPEQLPETIACITEVLDLACGPGGWGLELLRNYPHMHLKLIRKPASAW